MIDATLNDGLALSDSLCRATWRSRPGSFVSLMTLYESNYIRLKQLLGNLKQLPETQVSTTPGDCPLHLQVNERSRYTTTFTLTYRFVDGNSVMNDPDLEVRVYHDACLGEALRCERWHQHPALNELLVDTMQRNRVRQANREMDDRWQRNIMLNKWLDYCVERGHSFSHR